MGSRDIEKMQKAKRRLAAVTFLTNISLDGSYKDTGWCQEHARAGSHQSGIETGINGGTFLTSEMLEAVVCGEGKEFNDKDALSEALSRAGLTLSNSNGTTGYAVVAKIHHEKSDSGGSMYGSKTSLSTGSGLESVVTITPAKDSQAPVSILVTSRNCGSAEKENTAPGIILVDSQNGGRKRSNTNDLGNLAKGKRTEFSIGDTETVSYGQSAKHAHFSSAESIENVFPGIQVRLQKSGGVAHGGSGDPPTNMSSPPPPPLTKGEVKFFNIRENPHALPIIKNERLVISVGRRTPCVVFSSIPYTKSSRFSRVQDRVQEGLKRTRNTSGSRPLSSLSEPDPLEQLLHDGDREISYGHLLKPSNHPPCDPTFMAALVKILSGESTHPHIIYPGDAFEFSPVPSAPKTHAHVSRCMSYDGVMKPNTNTSTVTTTSGDNSGDENGPPPTLNNPAGLVYNPILLDDPELRAGKHRTLMTFPSYMTSVIDYCKAADLKKELNDKFRERFPHIQLTLSKMRSLKREMRRVAKSECNVDLLTVAQAYVYFEKLILGSFVTKSNRKYCAGACLLLSAKLNDIKGDSLHILIEKIETTFRVNRKDLLSFEFAVLVALEFALLLPAWEVAPHYQRLIYEA